MSGKRQKGATDGVVVKPPDPNKNATHRRICRCDCHQHPIYREPCSVCGHFNNEGEWIGSLWDGYWLKKIEV